MFIDFREGTKEREWEKHWCERETWVASRRSPGWGSNLQLLGAQDQTNWATWPGCNTELSEHRAGGIYDSSWCLSEVLAAQTTHTMFSPLWLPSFTASYFLLWKFPNIQKSRDYSMFTCLYSALVAKNTLPSTIYIVLCPHLIPSYNFTHKYEDF